MSQEMARMRQAGGGKEGHTRNGGIQDLLFQEGGGGGGRASCDDGRKEEEELLHLRKHKEMKKCMEEEASIRGGRE